MFYLNSFLLFSILGYLGELSLSLLTHQTKETLLIGPWMPIYGLGLLIVHAIHKKLTQYKLSKKKEVFFCFLLSVISLTLLEELGGLITATLFHRSFWNYEGLFLSIGPYINVFISLIWVILALIIVYLFYPLVAPFLKKTPRLLTYTLLLLFLLDNLYCLNKNFFSLFSSL